MLSVLTAFVEHFEGPVAQIELFQEVEAASVRWFYALVARNSCQLMLQLYTAYPYRDVTSTSSRRLIDCR